MGTFEKKDKRFRPESDIILLDDGFDFYAPQSFVDEKNFTNGIKDLNHQ